MKLDDMIPHEEVLARDLEDPEFRALWEKTALARWLAIEVAHYRAVHDLTQRELAEQLGMKQSQIGRLELGEHTPTLETLIRVAAGLELELMIDICPQGREPKLARKRAKRVTSFTVEDCEILAASA